MKFYCDNIIDGGGWALVRRVKQGTVWHPATDNLAGTEPAYGTYGGPTFDATFGRPYSSWLAPTTEFLFTTGSTDDNLLIFCALIAIDWNRFQATAACGL
jgi:hypothetical protein